MLRLPKAPRFASTHHLLSHLSETVSVFEGLQIHAHLIKLRLVQDRPQRNHLVNLYAKGALFCNARKVIEEIPEPDLICWSSLISGYVQNGLREEALLAFLQMHGFGTKGSHRAFPSVLKACASMKDYKFGKQIHGLVVVTGYDWDVYVANALIDMYAKCGDVRGSKTLFEDIPEKNVVCWNTLLSCYKENGSFLEAMELFREMVASGVRFDEFSLSTALNSVTALGDILQGRKIHCYLVKFGLESDPFSSNALVDMYAKGGDLGDSIAVFDRILARDIVSWNAVIAGCVLHEHHFKALELLIQMKRSGTYPNAHTLSSALKSCVSLGLHDFAYQLHATLMKMDAMDDPYVRAGLIDMYCKCNLMNEAETIFAGVPEKDLVSLNALICGRSQNGEDEEAVALFVEMHQKSSDFDQSTLLAVLNAVSGLENIGFCQQMHALIAKTGYTPDAFVVNSLVDSYRKCNRVEDAARVFDELEAADVPSYTSMMAACSQNGEGEQALKLYEKLLSRGLKPDSFVWSSLLNACAALSAYEQGKQVHVHVLKLGFMSDVVAGNSLVNMYAKCGSIEDADLAFSEVPEKTVVSWSAMIGGLAQHGRGKEALALFDDMLRGGGPPPNHVTLVSVLSACNHSGLVHEAEAYFQTMRERFGIEPTQEHYACMVDVLGRAGRLEEALELANRMPYEANASIWGSLLGVSKLHKDVVLGRLAAEKLYSLDPEKSGTHVLLANVYASAGLWQDVAKMRRVMKEERVKKEPGMSWVEVKDKIHTFIVGDRSHARSGEIYAKLEELGDEMGKAGYVAVLEGDLHNVEKKEKEKLLAHHSEKLAVAFALIATPAGASIRVKKNLRICLDCHTAFKYICRIVGREIVVRDVSRFHHFRDGACSCGDYW